MKLIKTLTVGFLFLIVMTSVPLVLAKTKTTDVSAETLVEDVEALQTTSETQGKSIATMTNQMAEMVSQFQTMNGDIGKADKKNQEQDKVVKDAQTRLQVLEDQISILTGQLQELKTEGLLKPAASERLTEFKAYSKGLEYVNAKNYTTAIRELRNFQGNYKKSVFNNNAQFWIAESYYMQADYEMAIKEYQGVLSKNSRSDKAPTALYRQGLAFYHLQSFDEAKAFFAKVIRSYPQAIEAIQASAQIKRIDQILELRRQQEIEMKSIE